MIEGTVAQIENWVDSIRDLDAGRALLDSLADRYGVNPITLQLIHSYSNSGTKDMIERELTDIKKKVLLASRPKPKDPVGHFRDIDYSKLTPELQKLYDQVKFWYQERDTLRGKSRGIDEGEELRQVVAQVVAIRKKIVLSMERLFYFDKYGVELDPTIDDMDRDEKVEQLTRWLRALKSNPPYISKNKKSEDPRIKLEVNRRQKEIEAINEYLSHAD